MTAAKRWTCDRCGVAVGRIDGEPMPLPESWASGADGESSASPAGARGPPRRRWRRPRDEHRAEVRAEARRAGADRVRGPPHARPSPTRRSPGPAAPRPRRSPPRAATCERPTSADRDRATAAAPPRAAGRPRWPLLQIGIALAAASRPDDQPRLAAQAPRLPARRAGPPPPAAAQRPRPRPLALVRRRLGPRGARLAGPRRRPLDGADLARPGGRSPAAP